MANETTKCPRCLGCGKVPLDPSLQETLDWIRANGDATAAQAAVGMKVTCGLTGMCQRLRRLYDLHLLGRRKVGKEWVYRALQL